MNLFSREKMQKMYGVGMERGSDYLWHRIVSVERIACKRATYGSHMYLYLVGPAGLQTQTDQREIVL